MAKPLKTLELHSPMIQCLMITVTQSRTVTLFTNATCFYFRSSRGLVIALRSVALIYSIYRAILFLFYYYFFFVSEGTLMMVAPIAK